MSTASMTAADHQIILHLKNVWHAVSAQAGEILVRLAVDNAFEADVPIFHDDVNRGHGGPSVFGEHRVAVDGAIERVAQLVIHRRRGQYIDVVGHAGNAVDALDRSFGVRLERGTRYLVLERDVVAIDFERQVIENGVVGKKEKLMANFAHKVLIRFGLSLTFGTVRCARRRYNGNDKREGDQRDTECSVLLHDMSPYVKFLVVRLLDSGPLGEDCKAVPCNGC